MSSVRGRLLAGAETVIAGLHGGLLPCYANAYHQDQRLGALEQHLEIGWALWVLRKITRHRDHESPCEPPLQYRFREEARIQRAELLEIT